MMKFRIFLTMTAALTAACATTGTRRMTDPQIAMIMRVANLSAVREGELAREKASDPAVREFATTMVTEHSAQNSKAESALSRVDIASEDTPRSRGIDAASGAATERLRALSGHDFDRAYIERQVQRDEALLELIDSTLMPEAHRKGCKEQLTELRGVIEKDLARARQIQGALSH